MDKINQFKEALILKKNQSNNKIVVQSDLSDSRSASQETFKNKEALKKVGFTWDATISAWTIDDVNFLLAKKTISDINKKEFLINRYEDLQEIVSNSDTDGFAKNDLMGKINMYIEDLANITEQTALSAEISRYLTFFSKFRKHSFYNTLLIWIQKPNASVVAGFKQWQTKYNRGVKKGAKAITIFAPRFNNNKEQTDNKIGDISTNQVDDEVTQKTLVGFIPVLVFDVSDTYALNKDGELPEQPEWFTTMEPTERTRELYKYTRELCDNLGINLTFSDAKGGEKGYSAGNHINMSSTIEGAGELSTLFHEIAHELMHWKTSSIFYQGEETKSDKALKELQAESVAYTVCKHYNLEVQHQPVYLALFKVNKEKILANLNVISRVAKFIIIEIDKIEEANKNVSNNRINESLSTKCQTPDAKYNIEIHDKGIKCKVDLPFKLNLNTDKAIELEKNLHNVLELALTKFFK